MNEKICGHLQMWLPFSKTIAQDNLHQVFSETLKLLKILVVTLMATVEPERCFFTLKKIKTFLRSTMTNERLSALGMLSIEKNYDC